MLNPKKIKKVFLILLMLLSINQLVAQDVDNIIKSKPFKFSGSLYVGGNGYSNFGTNAARQSPYSYSIVGSPTVSIYGISLPFTFSFSDQQFSYSQPFNIYGVSPKYKWAQIHLGYRSMNFSSFTMSGKQFYGAGIELTPGKFRFKALYGKLKDLFAQKDTLTFGSQILDTYERYINGVKIGYGNKNSFDFMYIKVKDDQNTSNPQRADNRYLLPEDNLVLGFNSNFTLFKYFRLYLETAASLHTADLRADIEIDEENLKKWAEKTNKLIEINASTRWGFSGKTGIDFNYRGFGIGANYLRVDPFFKSLGLYYMNTDYENYTGHLNFGLFKRQLQFRLTAGFQQNNISKLKQQTDLRKIGSLSINYFSQNGISISANYSNYQTDQAAGFIKVEDSIKLALVNEMAMISPSYSWNRGKYSHSASMNFNYQKFKDVNRFRIVSLVDDQNYTASIDYGLSHSPSTINFNIGVNYFILDSRESTDKQIGASFGISKKLLKKKLNIRLNSSWNKNIYNNISDGFSLNIRNYISYNITKNQNISFSFAWMNRTGIHRRNINELRSSINYGLSF